MANEKTLELNHLSQAFRAYDASLATVAKTNSYNDLSDKPDLSGLANTSSLATVATSGSYSDLTGTPTLATVATSGSYNDLSDTPTILTQADVNSAISSAVSSVYKYKGSVVDFATLPLTNNTIGDVYNTEETGMNYAWNGSSWDALGSTIEIAYATEQEVATAIQQVIDARS